MRSLGRSRSGPARLHCAVWPKGLAPLPVSDSFDVHVHRAVSSTVDLHERLATEFRRRLQRNPRYSLRAFARSLSLHHTTLARLINGTRRASRPLVSRIGRRLGLSPDEVLTLQQREVALKVLAAAQSSDFRADCRWIAMKTGVEVDDVNRALHLLIYERRLVMGNPTSWTVIGR